MNKVMIISAIFCLVIAVSFVPCNGRPADLFDDLMASDDQLLLGVADILDSINGDDTDYSGRGSSSNDVNQMKPTERCMLPVRKGACRALIPRFSYDPATKSCREFKFGGCDGNGNNFSTQKQCMQVCEGL